MSGLDPVTTNHQTPGEFVARGKNSDDMCSITGEVFSPQFLRNHAGVQHGMNFMDDHDPARAGYQFNQNYPLPSEEVNNGRIGMMRINSDGSNLFQAAELENNEQNSSKYSGARYMKRAPSGLIVPPRYAISSPQLNQHFGIVTTTTPESPLAGKLKFLCSFGGRIIPRPNDGKLRYVGGETRIISLRKDVTWEELMRKTSEICSQPHTIRYQLPGEDLDALISVCSDEDLNLMIEEYQELERTGSQRLRIFLVLLGEPESPCTSEADQQHYVYAVNGGLIDIKTRKSSSGKGSTRLIPQDYFHRESPTYSSPNKLPQMQNNFFNQSPPISPAKIYHRDYENSNSQFYVDHPLPESNERRIQKPLPYQNNQYRRGGMNLHSRSPSGDVYPIQLHAQSDLSCERPSLMERALSDSQLQEREVVISTPFRDNTDNISPAQSMLCPSYEIAETASECYKFDNNMDRPLIKKNSGQSFSNQHDRKDSMMQNALHFQKLAVNASSDRDSFQSTIDYTVEMSPNVGNNKEGSYDKPRFEKVLSVRSQPLSDSQDDKMLESTIATANSTISSYKSGVVSIANQAKTKLTSNITGRATDPDRGSTEGERINRNESFTDAAMLEIEAGIYGLQVVKDDDLEDVQELGSGTYGTVYYGKWRGTDVAIKRIKKSCFSGRVSEQERLIRDFWREAQILSTLHHPNVVAFYGVVPDGPGGTMATITEYMVSGSLRHAMEKKDRALDRRKKLMITLDAAFGMEYLHLKNIVHFDLTCENLLVNLRDPHRPICKVGDFGLSRIKRNTLVTGGVRGTLPWMAPELLNGNNDRVTEKVDVFSFGITMWEILTGEEPYANLHCGAIIGGIISNTLRPPIPEHCDTEWIKLMEECWSVDPQERPSFTEITNRLRAMSVALQPKRRNIYPNR
ncbi:uncharacterized protein [Rutidosis leptorrhynchoides]|uniref:uncharacterized protein n=1 Tax=Rutidosis leptorrhynchoides TaxID=125765 RepID=UPI003A98F325